jgi:hypothetical protein
MDISKLKPEQRELAYKIGEAAVKKGLNPDFVLPMVMQESGFDNSALSKKGAIGVMQIMPDTARLYKCDDPTNLDQNIDCGLNIIKDLVSKKNIGSDPYKVLAGYHSGEPEAATFLKTGNIDDLGPNAKQHLWDVSQRYGNELPSVVSGEATPQAPSSDASPAPKANFDAPKIASSNTEAGEASTVQEVPPYVGGIIGGVTGTGAGTQAAISKAKYDLAVEAYDRIMGRKDSAPTGTTSGEKWAAKTGYGKGAGTVQDVSSAYQRSAGKGKVSSKMDKLWGVAQVGEDPQLTQRLIDRARAAEQMTAAPSRLSRAASYIGNLGALPVKGGLMGAAAGFGAADAYNRYRAGDMGEATVGGLGTVASLVAPYVASMGALPAAGIAAPLYLTASDRIKRLAKRPEEIRLQEDDYDAMGNPLR